MNLVADESVDFGIVKKLRLEGYTIFSIGEGLSGIDDGEVLNFAYLKQCLLITEDKDFGELTYRLKLKHHGILLIRLNDLPRPERIELVCDILNKFQNELEMNFSVITKNGLRTKVRK